MTTTICGHCGDRIDGVSLEDHDDECQPECFRCAESFDAKTDILWHDCPEREGEDSGPPQPDRIPERERLDQRERQHEADGRAERRRLGRQR